MIQQFIVSSLINHLTAIHDDDLVGLAHRGQAMRDHDHRPAMR